MRSAIWFALSVTGVVAVGRMLAVAFFGLPITLEIAGPAVAWLIVLFAVIIAEGTINDSRDP